LKVLPSAVEVGVAEVVGVGGGRLVVGRVVVEVEDLVPEVDDSVPVDEVESVCTSPTPNWALSA